MNCEKCKRSASPLVEVITGQGHFVTSEAIGHRQPNIGTRIDFKEKWCVGCVVALAIAEGGSIAKSIRKMEVEK